jgi:hypothetical protein
MSDRLDGPPEMPSPPAFGPPQQRNGCLTAFMVVAGLVLLFPGLCVLLITGGKLDQRDILSPPGLLILLLALGGIALITWTLRRPSR